MNESQSQKGLGCLVLFGGIFLLAGLGIFLWQSSAIWKSWSANDWQPVQARLITVEQTVSHNDGSTSYGVKGQYEYKVNDQLYKSQQLNFHSGSDNIGNYQRSFYRKLSAAKHKNDSITVYYDPADPEKSVIDKGIRWEMIGFSSIFLLVFGGVGAGIIFAGFWAQKKGKREQALQKQFQEQPWKWKTEWQADYLSPNTKSSYIGIAVFAVFWNLISLPATIFGLPEIIKKEEYIGLLILLFPLVGIGLIFWTIVLFSRHKKYGRTQLHINEGRIKIGDFNTGYLQFAQNRFSQSNAILKLASIHKYESGSGKNRSKKEKILWEDTQRVELYSSECRFEFEVPRNLKPTDESNSKSQYLWRLSISSEQKGPDLKLDFEVPAFPLSEEERSLRDAQESDLFSEDRISNFQSKSMERGNWSKTGVIQSYSNLGVEYHFPRLNSATWIFMSLLGFLFVAIGVGVYIAGASILFPIIFGLVGGLLGVIGLRAALFKSRIYIDGSGLHYQTGHLAFGKTSSIQALDILDFDMTSQASSGNTKFYNLLLKTHNGQQHTLAKNLKVKGDILALIQHLKQELNL